VGDEVVAVGTPASITFAGTATFGRVSHSTRLLPLDDDGDGVYEKKITVIQTDTSVNPGNSGGPMADMYGRVVGMVVRKILSYQGSTYEGVGFAIPIDGARIILDAIIAHGSFTGVNPVVEGRSLLGITGHGGEQGLWYYVDPLTNKVEGSELELPGYHYMSADGVYVTDVQGANAKGKVLEGDVILAANGYFVRDTKELITLVNCYPCGQSVSLLVLRGGAEITVQVILDEE
jgi:serine protease Do